MISQQNMSVRNAIKRLCEMVKSKKAYLMVLSCVVVFITTYVLILPAVTLEQDEAAKQGGIDVPAQPASQEQSISQKDNGYEVSVNYKGETLPEGTRMEAAEISKSDDSYEALQEDALQAVREDSGNNDCNIAFAKFYDISLIFDDEIIEPDGPVDVTISYDKALKVSDADNLRIVHFAVDEESGEVTPEVIDPERVAPDINKNKLTGTTFEAKSFSVFAVIYTVDFEYSVNGKMYQFSLPGGGFVSFTDLVEVLGIIGDTYSEENDAEIEEQITDGMLDVTASDAAKKFVADVESVEFSSPELVWVGKVDTETTVGTLKEANGLECEYSAELTEEQIARINDTVIESGDWALISMLPFASEETLTVTMKTGEVLTIRVTDAQIKKTVISTSGETYEITVTYDDRAEIPDGAELKVKEILPEDERYDEYYQQSLEKVGVVDTATEEEPETVADAVTDALDGLKDLISGDSTDDEEEEGAKQTSDYARIFDIQIWADDHEIQPKSAVTVNINLLDAPEDEKAVPSVVHFAKAGAELMELVEKAENSETDGIQFVTDEFSVYSVVYTVDFFFEVNGKVYGFNMDGADSVSLRALVEALHVYEAKPDGEKEAESPAKSTDEEAEPYVESEVNNDELDDSTEIQSELLDLFMREVETVAFSNEELLVPAKVDENTTVGKIKTALKLFPTYPLGLKQSEVLALNEKEYSAGDWALISMKPFDTQETLTITLKNGDSFKILVTDAQDAVMIGDQVQTISNPAGTTIDLFDYWIVSQDLVGRDGWGDLNQSQGSAEAGDDKPLNGTGNNKGINSSTTDTEHGHALKFSPAWSGTVYNGNKIGTTGNAWQSVNLDMRDGLNSYTGDEYTWHWNCPNPFTGIVQSNLSNGYPILTNNQTIGTNGESLAYLFDPSISHSGKASYSDVNQLLYVDKDGYYTYDSRDYAASFNTGDKTFTLTEQTSTNSEIRGFWPFGTQNFWTGMHVNTQFSIPTGGQVLNPSGVLKPMQFEFSGDDDVWIYVDGILIGDAGGIHNRTEVDINFQTGIVSISGSADKYLDDLFRTGLRDQGKTEAEIEAYIDANFDGHTFKAGSYHTFDFFYLERGGGESNLYIHYNLVSTADFTAHKSYYGANETDLLTRDQFQFELIGLDGKYRSVRNNETGNYELVQEDTTSEAIMPHASGSGEGTVASPHYEDDVTIATSSGNVNSQVYITGVSEDGNVNFGTASISEMDMHDADEGNPPVYKYIIREIVPDDAKNAAGVTWAEATDEQRAAGGFVKDQVTYDGTVYYMTGRVTSWTETNASGQEVVRHGISKTYYTDDTYTTVKSDVNFASFENRFTPDFGNVDFKKVDGTGAALQGATFALYTDEACTKPAKDLDSEGTPEWTATSDENGTVSFENVRVGTYYMKETVAPNDYVLDETIYKVVIEDSKDTSKKSKITILGDETETEITEIANAKSGKITVLKKWLNASGAEIDGGSNAATVKLKRYKQIVESSDVETHTVTINLAIRDYGGNSWTETTTKSFQGDHVTVEWTVVDGAGEGVFTGQDSSYWDESSHITVFSKSFSNVSSDITLNVTLNEYWPMQNGKFNIDSFSVAQEEPDEPVINIVADDDFNPGPITLNSSSSWSHTWNIGGSESSHTGFDYPVMDDNGKNYLYYVVELDAQGNPVEVGGSPLEGYVLQGYSANNNTGISNQGVITVYNRTESSNTINVVIKKTDNAENSTNYLAGAVFKLMYRSDGSSTFTNVSNEIVPELDSESKFTVPTSGITLTGLVDGQYQLQEISPPSGYVITNSTPVTFTVSGGSISNTDGTITGVKYTAATETGDAEFTIPNEPGVALPNTGGPGTRLFTILGSILILGAGVLLWRRRRLI